LRAPVSFYATALVRRQFMTPKLCGFAQPATVIRNFRITAVDGKTYDTVHYNLDEIISVGYRVKSAQGTRFRQWATHTLREHLMQGYTLNQARLAEKDMAEAQQAIDLLARTLQNQELINQAGRELGSLGKSVRSARERNELEPAICISACGKWIQIDVN
jgi:hypothetical protein